MAHVKLLEESESEITAKAHGEDGTTVRDTPDGGRVETPVVSKNEGTVSSGVT
jgi:hypothetical protein